MGFDDDLSPASQTLPAGKSLRGNFFNAKINQLDLQLPTAMFDYKSIS